MQENNDFSLKAARQILRGWKAAGLDFLPHSLEAPVPRPTLENGVSTPVAVSEASNWAASQSKLSPTQTAATLETSSEMPPSKKSPLPAVILQDSNPIWPDSKRLGKETRITLLDEIRSEVVNCTLCKELASCRTQTVFGVGNVRPRLCFFGEAPGADEDKQGEPFVGRAGQLLDKIIEAMTLKRTDVYILNTLKCRPPSNRTPLPDEVENCRTYFTRQLEILRPEFLVCLGACAAQALLQTKETIGKLRGKAHDFRGIKVYATYHPAYLLRNPPAKRDVWEDMKVVMKEMGMAIPKT